MAERKITKSQTNNYKEKVKERLDLLTPILQKIAMGDFSIKFEIPEKEDEFTELFVTLELMIDDLREMKEELNSQIKEKEKRVDELNRMRKILYSLNEDIQDEKKVVEKKVEERTKELSEEHGKLFSLVESVKLGIVMVDLNMRVILSNPTARYILGKNKNRPISFDDLKEKLKGINLSHSLSFYVKDHEHLDIKELKIGEGYFRIFVSSVRDIKEKNFLGSVIIIENITEQKLIEKTKDAFLSVTSHQLRTPLTAIKLYVEMLLNEDVGKLNTSQKEYVGDVQISTERMIKLVNDLLNVSNLESGKLQIEPKPTQLEDFIEVVIKEVNDSFKKKKFVINFNKPKTKNKKIPLDQILLRQVFSNLISNAVKYSLEGGKVEVKLEKRKNDFLFSIKDHGIGISKQFQSRIFHKFFRTDKAIKTVPDGSGLGLYVSKLIIKAIEGKIWFESEENKGTTFFVSIPLGGIKKKKGEIRLIN